jgi:16S rRNA (adenine1518-N6/adenine1519-N6)-dimethyltransferase
LATAAGRVVAVELDQRLFPVLEQELIDFSNVELVHADILTLDPTAYFQSPNPSTGSAQVLPVSQPPWKGTSVVSSLQSPVSTYKVVGNVPYYITGAILRHLLSASLKPFCMVLTVQKEVAERLTAVPPNMSLLAVSVQVYGQVDVVMTIKAGAFWPRPDVDSAVVRINVDPQHLGNQPAFDEDLFFRLLRAGFSQKRKQLKNNLKSLGYGEAAVEQALNKAGVDGRRRAETLTLDEWHALSASF